MISINGARTKLESAATKIDSGDIEGAYFICLGTVEELVAILRKGDQEERLLAVPLLHQFIGLIELVLSSNRDKLSRCPSGIEDIKPIEEKSSESSILQSESLTSISLISRGTKARKCPIIPVSPLWLKYEKIIPPSPVDADSAMTVTTPEGGTAMLSGDDEANYASLNKLMTQFYFAAHILSPRTFRAPVIAYYLTIIEYHLYCKIEPNDMLRHKPPADPAPNIHMSSEFFNYLTRVIEYSILEPESPSERALFIYSWIKIASNLQSLRNFQTLKAVLSALRTPPIARLKKTWSLVPRKSHSTLKSMTDSLSENDNYKVYRQYLQPPLTRPMVPYFGLFLHDLTYLTALCTSEGIEPAFDVRVLDLFNQVTFFQSGPKYSGHRPALSSASSGGHQEVSTLTLMLGKRTPFRDGLPLQVQTFLKSLDETEMGELVSHWILSRSWFGEREMDDLSLLREPRSGEMGTASSGSTVNMRGDDASSIADNASISDSVSSASQPLQSRAGLEYVTKNGILFPASIVLAYSAHGQSTNTFLRRAVSANRNRSTSNNMQAMGVMDTIKASTTSVVKKMGHLRHRSVPVGTLDTTHLKAQIEMMASIPSNGNMLEPITPTPTSSSSPEHGVEISEANSPTSDQDQPSELTPENASPRRASIMSRLRSSSSPQKVNISPRSSNADVPERSRSIWRRNRISKADPNESDPVDLDMDGVEPKIIGAGESFPDSPV